MSGPSWNQSDRSFQSCSISAVPVASSSDAGHAVVDALACDPQTAPAGVIAKEGCK